jgi:hypothetical protein
MSEWIIALYAILSGIYLHTLKTKSFEKFFSRHKVSEDKFVLQPQLMSGMYWVLFL